MRIPQARRTSLRGLALLLAVAGVLVAAAPAPADTGAFRVLVARLTWGPLPFTDADVEAAIAPVPAFYATASFGQVSLTFSETPWLTLLPSGTVCLTDPYAIAFSQSVHDLLARAGYPAASYDRLVVVIPSEGDCVFGGITHGSVTVLNGNLSTGYVAHELGHSFGMGHAGAFTCRYSTSGHRFCRGDFYGDPWDVMGAGWQVPQFGDFGALQKVRAGWVTSYTEVSKPGVYQLASLEQASALPQALIIRAGSFEYWVDHREPVGNDAFLAADTGSPVTGFEVHRITGDPLALPPDMPTPPYYLLPTGGSNRLYTPVGSTFTVAGVFALVAVSRTNSVMSVRFRWLDRTPRARRKSTPSTVRPSPSRRAPIAAPASTTTSSGSTAGRLGQCLRRRLRLHRSELDACPRPPRRPRPLRRPREAHLRVLPIANETLVCCRVRKGCVKQFADARVGAAALQTLVLRDRRVSGDLGRPRIVDHSGVDSDPALPVEHGRVLLLAEESAPAAAARDQSVRRRLTARALDAAVGTHTLLLSVLVVSPGTVGAARPRPGAFRM